MDRIRWHAGTLMVALLREVVVKLIVYDFPVLCLA